MRINRKDELIETITQLNEKIAQLERIVSQLSRPVIEHVTIERLYVQNPVLERLEFGLDNIDIKELSGALNLGNNFGVNVDKPKYTPSKTFADNIPKTKLTTNLPTSSTTDPTTKPKNQQPYSIHKTSSGYSYKARKETHER